MHAGDDVIVALSTVGANELTSNVARVHWASGPHATFLALSGTSGATAGQPVTLSATLVDRAADPPAAIAGASVHFAVGGQSCSGTSNAQGLATCSVTLASPGIYTLTASYAGSTQFLPASASTLFVVPTDGIDRIFADGFETP